MVSVMTTLLPSTLVAHAGGKLCEHLTAAQARWPASILSCGVRPNPPLTPQGLSHHVGSPDDVGGRREEFDVGAAVIVGSLQLQRDLVGVGVGLKAEPMHYRGHQTRGPGEGPTQCTCQGGFMTSEQVRPSRGRGRTGSLLSRTSSSHTRSID